jgi:ankyrin repeat protein
VDKLVSLGNGKNATVEYGWSPIEVAGYTGQLEIMIFMMEHANEKHQTTAKYDGINLLQNAALRGQLELVELVLDTDTNPDANEEINNNGESPYEVAQQAGVLAIVGLVNSVLDRLTGLSEMYGLGTRRPSSS